MTQMDKNMWVSTIKATMCFTGYQIACRRRCGSREVYSSGLSKENLNCRKCSTMQKYRPDGKVLLSYPMFYSGSYFQELFMAQ